MPLLQGPNRPGPFLLLHARENDSLLIALADQLWGEADGSGQYLHTYGKGRVYGGQSLEEVMAIEALQPDFSTDDGEAATPAVDS